MEHTNENYKWNEKLQLKISKGMEILNKYFIMRFTSQFNYNFT